LLMVLVVPEFISQLNNETLGIHCGWTLLHI
jgi:hypothetical protein